MSFWTSKQSPIDPQRYEFKALREGCVGPPDRQFFMGGVAMAAAIEALETHLERPLLWATMQFVSHGMLDDEISIQIEPASGGRNIKQVAASISTEDRKLQNVMAALGSRQDDFAEQFIAMPDVPAPADCREKPVDTFGQTGNLLDQIERRVAFQDDATGREYLWLRANFETATSAALLALFADFFLGAHSRTMSGTSLDNTFRVCQLVPTDWVLHVIQLDNIARGVVNGSVHQFAEDGTLLAVGSQTGLLPRG